MEANTLKGICLAFAEAFTKAADLLEKEATDAVMEIHMPAAPVQMPVQAAQQPYPMQFTPSAPPAQSYQGQPAMGTAPVPKPVAQSAQQPMTQAPVSGGMVPTTAVAQEYTQDQLAVACSGLVNQGKQMQLLQILQGFGVAALVDLPKEKYGDFVTALRAEGAVI